MDGTPGRVVTGRGSHRGRQLLPGAIGLGAVLLLAIVLTRLPGTPTASSAPSLEASPPPTDVIPTPTGAQIEPTGSGIVDRPGVPADLSGLYWSVGSIVGSVGTTEQHTVPENESPIAVGGGYVVSTIDRTEGGSTTSSLVIRKFESQLPTVRTIDTDLTRVRGTVVGSRLFWVGMYAVGLGEGEASTIDGGIWTVDLTDAAAEPGFIVPPGEDLSGYGEFVERGFIATSQTGETLVSRVGGPNGSRSDLIAVGSLSIRQQVSERVIALSDAWIYVYRGSEPDASIAALDLESGAEYWAYPVEGPDGSFLALNAVVAFGGRLVVDFHRVRDGVHESVVASIDADGLSEELLVRVLDEQSALHIATSLSSATHLTLVTELPEELAIAEGEPVSLLVLSTGELVENAFQIGPT